MRRFHVARAVSVLALTCLAPIGAHAQTEYGSIQGTVTDTTGAVVPGVTVTLTGSLVLAPQVAATGPTGGFSLPALVAGGYELTFALDGFQTQRTEAVLVRVGRTTAADVTLAVAGGVESVTVIANPSTVDVRQTDVAVNVDSGLLTGVPAARDIWSLLQTQAPGLVVEAEDVGGSIGGFQRFFQAHGTSGFLNSFTLNGANIASAVGEVVLYPDPDSFEEIQISTASHPVEVASPGVHLNLVTKSGGDVFSGGAAYFYEHSSFASTNIDDALGDQGVFRGSSVQLLSDFTADLGGPIVREKLRFYANWRDYRVDRNIVNFPVPNETHIFGGLANVTYQVNAANRITGLVSVQPLSYSRRLGSAMFAPEATWFQDDLNRTFQVVWTSVLSPATVLDARVSYVPYNFRLNPQDGVREASNFDLATGFISRAVPVYFDLFRDRLSASAVVNHFVAGRGGDHRLKFGGEYQRAGDNNVETRVRDVLTFTLGGVPSFVSLFNTPIVDNQQRFTEVNLYGQDSWTPQDRLTINLGARFSAVRGFTPVQGSPAGTFSPARSFARQDLISWNSVAPRVGAVYDLTGEGTRALKVSYGRYYHPLAPVLHGRRQSQLPRQSVPSLERRRRRRVPGWRGGSAAVQGGRDDPERRNGHRSRPGAEAAPYRRDYCRVRGRAPAADRVLGELRLPQEV